MITRKFYFAFLFLTVFTSGISYGDAIPGPAGCLQTQHYLGILKLYSLHEPAEAAEMIREMNFVKVQACAGSYRESDTIRYRNGRTATSYAGHEDATWYWPNGRTITSYALREDASIYYPNGRTMTSYFLRPDATYYYADGRTLSSYIGRQGATLYLKDGTSVNSPGFTVNGKLDFLAMTDYVEALNTGNPSQPSCDNATMKSSIRQSIEYIRANQNNRAIELLDQVQSCL